MQPTNRTAQILEVESLVLQFIASVVMHNQQVSQLVGLGATDAQFLTLLTVHGPMSPGQLAERTGLSSGTVTGVLDRLESAGYVDRRHDTADRRRVIVTPVPQALERLGRHYEAHGRLLREVLTRRTDDELATLTAFLAELVAR